MSRPDAKTRLFGIPHRVYMAMTPGDKDEARKEATERLQERFMTIFQRRHDCIHNCDRPRMSPQPMDKGRTVLKVIQDVEYLVLRCEEQFNAEFRQFLIGIGCSATTIALAGY
ncbi:MAG: hypothetical protein ACHRXM_01295 [Isosphaerales bacterium]